jgi:ankyrin repeat protein
MSNHLDGLWRMDTFIETLLQRVSWSILRPILSVQAPSIQAFTEGVFLYAITSQWIHVVKDLLSHEHIKATVISNGSALVSAVRTSSCKLVSLILDVGACPNQKNFEKVLPLTEARDVSVAKLLLEAGADVNACGEAELDSGQYLYAVPAVVTATGSKNIGLVRYLIREGADVNMVGWDITKRRKYSAVMIAVEGSMIEVLTILLQSGARTNATSMTERHNLYEIYPLQEAAGRGEIEIAQLLIEYGGNVNALAHGKVGTTALEAAVSQADIGMTKLLLEKGADVNTPGKSDTQHRYRSLTTAVETNQLELVKIMLDAGAHVNNLSCGFHGCIALATATWFPHASDIHDLLVARGAQCNTPLTEEHRQIQLREAVFTADLARVKAVLGTGLKVDIQPFEDSRHPDMGLRLWRDQHRSILQDAVLAGNDIFQLLFSTVKHYDEEDVDLHPVLVEAIGAGDFDIQATLLKAGTNINSTRCHAGKMIGTPVMIAASMYDLDAVKFLYDKGADINIVVEDFELSLFQPACTALQVSLCPTQYGNGSPEIFQFLREHGAIVNAPIGSIFGLSELALAVQIRNPAIVRELLDAGANVNSLPAECEGRTALQAAAGGLFENTDIVQLLLERGADVNALSARENGTTALGAAAGHGHFQVALILLKAGADVNTEFGHPDQITALVMAASWGRLDVVHLLLKAGADLHLPKHKRYVEAAAVARSCGHIAIATLLETWKVDEALERLIGAEISLNREEGFVMELY